MAHFRQTSNDKATFEKCLTAIRQACSTELWLDQFVMESEKKGMITTSMNVLLHWYKSFDNTDINYQFIDSSKDAAAYYYTDSTGRVLNICDKDNRSVVYHTIGFPDMFKEKLEGLEHDDLYEQLELLIPQFVNESDFDLVITRTDNA